MAMSDSKSEIDRKFREIIGPQIRPEMAQTLCDFIASGRVKSQSTVDYVFARLWVNTPDPRKGPE